MAFETQKTLPAGQASAERISAERISAGGDKPPKKPRRSYIELKKMVAEKVIEVREKAGLSQEELAERLDVPVSKIISLEAGKVIPSTKMMKRVGAATGHYFVPKFTRI